MQRGGLKATPAVAPRQLAASIFARLEKKKRGQTIDELVEDSEIKELLGECSRAQRLQLVRLELGELSVEVLARIRKRSFLIMRRRLSGKIVRVGFLARELAVRY